MTASTGAYTKATVVEALNATRAAHQEGIDLAMATFTEQLDERIKVVEQHAIKGSLLFDYIERLSEAHAALESADSLEDRRVAAREVIDAIRWTPTYGQYDGLSVQHKDLLTATELTPDIVREHRRHIEKIDRKLKLVNDYTGDAFTFTALKELGLLGYLR